MSVASKKRKLTFDFLISPDNPTGEVDPADELDDDHLERMERAEQRVQTMDAAQYLEFTECRQVNFHKKISKFRDWLDCVSLIDAKPSVPVMELMGYLAYETVGELVNLALLVKRDMDGHSEPLSGSYTVPVDRPPMAHAYGKTPTFVTTPIVIASPGQSPAPSPPSSPSTPATFPSSAGQDIATEKTISKTQIRGRKRQRSKGNSLPLTMLQFPNPIRPSHIREAFRRHYQQPTGPMSPFSCHSQPTVRRQVLCC
eukprot:m.133632 g.133632  ORF g.133632 m.133632 type:complete len:256 (+) comp38128_c0_seq26:4630-5397(+)